MSFDFTEHVRRHVFPVGASPAPLMGAEVELLSFDAVTREPVEAAGRILPFLNDRAAALNGTVRHEGKAGTRVVLPHGGVIGIEPGGQIEYASPPCRTPSALVNDLERVLLPLRAAAEDGGILLLGTGIDPWNPIGRARLQITTQRYCSMDAYFESIGPAGRRMMRQTAAVQVSIDASAEPTLVWRLLQAAAPYLTALFANSSRYAGGDTGMASFRADNWRHVDPARTGLIEAGADPFEDYARFALNAPVMRPHPAGGYRPFREWAGEQTPGASWEEHLSTLFPEVRPRGYFEVRCIDAQPPEHVATPVLLLAGMALDERTLKAVADLLGDPDPALLVRAGRAGLADAGLAERTGRRSRGAACGTW
jgi:glutamate--cysteine ligase